MFHDGGQRDGKRLGKLADREAPARLKLREERAPGRVGEGRESPVEDGFLILNHMVKLQPRR